MWWAMSDEIHSAYLKSFSIILVLNSIAGHMWILDQLGGPHLKKMSKLKFSQSLLNLSTIIKLTLFQIRPWIILVQW